ncbi:MAG: carbon-nitrogen hydrolase family protein [Alphaproteobacteria bacterium]
MQNNNHPDQQTPEISSTPEVMAQVDSPLPTPPNSPTPPTSPTSPPPMDDKTKINGDVKAPSHQSASDDHSKSNKKWRVALAEISSGKNPARNILLITRLIKKAKKRGAYLIAFPEVCNIMEQDKNKAWDVLSYEEDDTHLTTIKNLARDEGIWVLLGSYLLKAKNNDANIKKFHNRSYLISDKGEIVGRYDKIHLFDINLANGESHRESESVVAGSVIVTCVGPFPEKYFGKLGLTICYDVRFPYLYRKLNHLGAGIIFVPSAFTMTTGRAHWYSLLRARAIENACFIIAPAQTGRHSDGRRTFGHSMVIDPWGRVIKYARKKLFGTTRLILADLDEAAMMAARNQIPAYRVHLDYAMS